jgi:hypothetical protein
MCLIFRGKILFTKNQETKMKKTENKNPKKTKFILLGITAGFLALGGLGYWYFVGRKGVEADNSDEDVIKQLSDQKGANSPKPKPKSKTTPKITSTPKTQNQSPQPSATNSPTVVDFILKKGSNGEQVKKLQDALIKKYGKQILPKFGADSDFGTETEKALLSKGFPTTINSEEYKKIISELTEMPVINTGIDPKAKEAVDIAKNIWLYSTTKKLNLLLEQLKRMGSVADYVRVNELFKTIRLGGVRQTIVNGTLSSFDDATSKQFITNEFIRMGLKYDGEKWALAGIYEKQIATNQETTICSIHGLNLAVPEHTILGIELNRGRFNTRFRSHNNQILYVPTKHIRYV